MEITLQISDSAYQQLMEGGKRIQGSVGLTTPHAGNFNEYSRRPAAYRKGERVVRLRHGKARVNRAQVSLRLNIRLDEPQVCPSEIIESESREASHFVDYELEDFRDTFGW